MCSHEDNRSVYGDGRHAAPLVRSLPHDRAACPALTDLVLCSKDHVCNNQQKVSNGSQDVTDAD